MVDTLSSRSIANLDGNLSANPAVLPLQYDTAGFNIGARVVQTSDFCHATTGGLGTTASTYRLVRLRSNVKIKNVKFFTSVVLDSNATPTLAFDVGVYYSDNSANDGTSPSNTGSISTSAFFSAVATPQTAKLSGALTTALIAPANMDQMLWDFLGLTASGGLDAIYGDPGGYFDIVAAVHTVAATAVAGDLAVIVDYAE